MRKITYDENADAAYLAFTAIPEGGVALSVPINEDLILDVDANGTVLGLEILNARSFFSDLAHGMGGSLELPEQIDPETFDPLTLYPSHAEPQS